MKSNFCRVWKHEDKKFRKVCYCHLYSTPVHHWNQCPNKCSWLCRPPARLSEYVYQASPAACQFVRNHDPAQTNFGQTLSDSWARFWGKLWGVLPMGTQHRAWGPGQGYLTRLYWDGAARTKLYYSTVLDFTTDYICWVFFSSEEKEATMLTPFFMDRELLLRLDSTAEDTSERVEDSKCNSPSRFDASHDVPTGPVFIIL